MTKPTILPSFYLINCDSIAYKYLIWYLDKKFRQKYNFFHTLFLENPTPNRKNRGSFERVDLEKTIAPPICTPTCFYDVFGCAWPRQQ
jgi:hypothetical protein